jgi:hypothetical protein
MFRISYLGNIIYSAMKSLFRKHYERNKRNNKAVKNPVIPAESEINIAVEKRSHAEPGDVPSSGNNISDNNVFQMGSLNMLNESVNSQKDDNTNVLKQVADCRNYQQMQPDIETTKHYAISVESSSRAAAGRSSHTEGDEAWSNRSVSESHLSQIQSLTIPNGRVDNQKHDSSSVLRHMGDWQQDNMQVMKSKTFSQAQFENEDVAHWKPQKDGMELKMSNNVRCQRNQNSAPTRGFVVVPKKVRISGGE